MVALCYYQIIEFNALRKKNGFLLKLFRFSISRLLSLSDEALDTHHRLETDKRKHGESYIITDTFQQINQRIKDSLRRRKTILILYIYFVSRGKANWIIPMPCPVFSF